MARRYESDGPEYKIRCQLQKLNLVGCSVLKYFLLQTIKRFLVPVTTQLNRPRPEIRIAYNLK